MKRQDQSPRTHVLPAGKPQFKNNILKDFRNAPFYIHYLFHMANLRMFPLSFLSAYTMDHGLP